MARPNCGGILSRQDTIPRAVIIVLNESSTNPRVEKTEGRKAGKESVKKSVISSQELQLKRITK
jgi:hypothetical protein